MKMQKLVLSMLLLGATISTIQAQTEKGKLLVGGNIGYTNTKTTESGNTNRVDKNSQLNFNPQIGFFVAKNLALGLSFNSGSYKQISSYTSNTNASASTYNNKYTTRTLTVGPFVRYYTMVGEKAGFFGQLTGGYINNKTANSSNNPDYISSQTRSTGGYAEVIPGFVFFPTNKLGLELTSGNLSYSKTKGDNALLGSKASLSNFAANFSLQYLRVGASFYLGKS